MHGQTSNVLGKEKHGRRAKKKVMIHPVKPVNHGGRDVNNAWSNQQCHGREGGVGNEARA